MRNNQLKVFEDEKILYWANNKSNLTTEEAEQLCRELKNIIEHNTLDSIIIDNRELKGVWNTNLDSIWIELMKYLPSKVPKTATLCDNIINKLQLDYLAKKSGTNKDIKAFTLKEKDELKKFLELNTLDFFM